MYGKEELLIQVYVREILALVLVKKENNVTQLYDKLNAQLRALATLGLTKDKYAAFLLPMVESALSEQSIRTWERTKSSSKDVTEELANLLNFLKKEVDSEQRIEISRKTFKTEDKKEYQAKIPTAECLFTSSYKAQPKKPITTCIWCEKETHSNVECYKEQKLTLDQRKKHLKEKKAYTICLRKGHHPKVCKASVKCLIRRYSTLVCEERKQEQKPAVNEKADKSTSLSSVYPKGETLLQTVVVQIEHNNKNLPVRVLFDSGSQQTYIRQDVADKLKIAPVRKELLAHCLFGGMETSTKEYNVYVVKVKCLDTPFSMNVSVNPIGETLLQIVVVQIEHNNKNLPVRVLFDSGSQQTYIRQDVADKLKIAPVRKELLAHCLFGGMETSTEEYNVYVVRVKCLDTPFSMNVLSISQNQICGNIPKVDSNNVQFNNLLKEHNVTLTDKGDTTEIGMLIGADFLGFLLTGSIVQLHNGLFAVRTKLGWTLQGIHVSSVTNSNLTTVLHCKCDNDLTGYWALEMLGIQDPAEVKSKKDAAADIIKSFDETIEYKDGRYEVKLPIKLSFQDLLPNYGEAKMRLDSMTKKLLSSDKFMEYHTILKNWVDLGIIEKVDHNPNIGHFLPHRPVIKEQSLTCNMRPVFDALATDKNGLSLNTCLEKGTNLIDLIPNLINGFRTGVIGITADIEKAFLQINLAENDRDFLKLLWHKDNTMKEIITYRHCRVVFGLACSPFLLSATLQHHLNKMKDCPLERTAETLDRSLYVDNCLVSVNTKEEANKFIEQAKNIMLKAKFNLRMWVTSQGINKTGKTTISVLGLNWDTVSDELFCNYKNLPPYDSIQNITKRGLLSLTQKVFDPIGYTSPVMLTPKLILQETWRRQLTWDQELPSDLLSQIRDWYKDIHYLKDCIIPRRLTTDILKETKVSLHLFCDASKDGCAACVLLRAQKGDNVTVQLISAKSRVTPSQKVTIPRLELTAALIGSRLISNVRENPSILDCPEYCWTYSGVTLCWIKRKLPLNTFVGNRVKEIREHTNKKNWYHIPGEQNWADLGSRGCTANMLLNLRWWEGPTWLRREPEEWPDSVLVVDEREVQLETKNGSM